jgi:uncharacterized protein YndB with AHSA1/START domain
MDKPQYIYVTYITATPEEVWTALTDPETTSKYWQHVNVSDWQPGSPWEHQQNGKGGGSPSGRKGP